MQRQFYISEQLSKDTDKKIDDIQTINLCYSLFGVVFLSGGVCARAEEGGFCPGSFVLDPCQWYMQASIFCIRHSYYSNQQFLNDVNVGKTKVHIIYDHHHIASHLCMFSTEITLCLIEVSIITYSYAFKCNLYNFFNISPFLLIL
jgi:hypothetical protein